MITIFDVAMPNLFICLTPLQALIAQHLIRQTAPTPADLLMVCYAEADNAKFRHYYQQTAQLCRHAQFVRVPRNTWLREIVLPCITRSLVSSYDTIYVASIDNPNVQYPLSHLHFNRLETFDDGTANLYPNSILYRTQYYGKKARIIRKLQGIRYTTEDLRALSAQHHTLYPTQNNIATPTIPLQLWANHDIDEHSDSLNVQKILLGQPLFDRETDNIALFQTLQNWVNAQSPQTAPLSYLPHPREHYTVNQIEYINTPLIFEDYLGQQLQQHPHTEFHIYHIASTGALNVANFPRTHIHAIQPQGELFKQATFQYLYDLMKQMGIPIHTL